MNDVLVHEVKQTIIEALNLEDITPDEIDTEAPLFGEGLGLDSIDALELGLAIKAKYGVYISPDSEEVKKHFGSVKNLVEFIEQARTSKSE